MRELFKEHRFLNIASLMTEVPYGPKTFPRYKLGSINYFCTKTEKVIFHPLAPLMLLFCPYLYCTIICIILHYNMYYFHFTLQEPC